MLQNMRIHTHTLKHKYKFPFICDWVNSIAYSVRSHLLGLWMNWSGRYKVKIPQPSLITPPPIPYNQKHFWSLVRKTVFPEPIKMWPVLNLPNFNGPWHTGCLLGSLSFLFSAYIPASTPRQVSKGQWMTMTKTQQWFKSKWQSCEHTY